MNEAVVVVTVDLELAWGFNYELLSNYSIAAKYLPIIIRNSRRNVRTLLRFSEMFHIPFTWAVVGHLFLKSCTREGYSLPHSDMPRPELNLRRDWYSNDPCSNVDAYPIWYGSDIISELLASNIDHEIGCHSFSHVDFSRCSGKVALSEIRTCKQVMSRHGIEPKSFVFPDEGVGHLGILKQEGFKVFRFENARLPHTCGLRYSNSRSSKPLGVLHEIMWPEVEEPVEADGLMGIPSSMVFQSPHRIGAMRLLMTARRGISKAVKAKKIFHITMHDYLESGYLLGILSHVLSYVAQLNRKGRLRTMTMGQFWAERASNQ
ncbi:polysaccharide deacetylase family protein [Candidatus Bathyarchaeota archaeon]|nr:polysaccharide deacetylase family protein [Candidatus Bathyarchaeota archaeon]